MDEKDEFGMTALMMAAAERSMGEIVVRMLAESGAMVDARNGTGMTALMRAAMMGRDKSAMALIEAGADIFALDDSGMSAGEHAKRGGTDKLAERLWALEAKAEAEEIGKDALAG